ncbi:MAG TPA: peroxidase [Solibacterales bacterium]|nr:peroxidase [Bryobacterales bacterium]
MEPMFLPGVEAAPQPESPYSKLIAACRSRGAGYPLIWHLFAFKPAAAQHLERFTQEVMRGPSPLSPGFRELIAAMTSARNGCPF